MCSLPLTGMYSLRYFPSDAFFNDRVYKFEGKSVSEGFVSGCFAKVEFGLFRLSFYFAFSDFWYAETYNTDQTDPYIFLTLIRLVTSALSFLPSCISNGVGFDPVCVVNRITHTLLLDLRPGIDYAPN